MQSGSDSVLRRMRRRWGSRRYVDRCQLFAERLDQPAITTDIIVGFPGETDAEFQQTCDVARQVGFSKIHIFPFSARRGTPAAEMPGQLPKHVKGERSRELGRLEAELREKYFSSLAGKRLRVLVESPLEDDPALAVGTSCRYAPVEVPSDRAACGQFVDIIAGPIQAGRIKAVS
jgi:threonylcarbamoyladenosine tRNA methylthiotransferase MtaB